MKSLASAPVLALLLSGVAHAQTHDAAQSGPAPAPGSNLEAGGLAPPEAVQSTEQEAPPSETEQELDRADREDSGRGLEFFWLNAEVGIAHLGLSTLSDDALVGGPIDSTYTGVLYGGGIGLRLLVFTAGARFRLNNFEKGQIWSLNGEGGMHIPLGALEPYFTLGAGYTSVGAFEGGACGDCDLSAVDVKGFNLRAAAGLDLYLSNTFSVGGNLSGDFTFLSRSAVPAADLGTLDPTLYGKEGSGIGAGVAFSAVVGLHF